VWNAPDAVTSVKLHYSANAGIEASLETGLNGTALDLVDATLTDEQIAIAPHLASMSAFAGEWDADAAKAVLKTQTVLGGYNDEGKLVAATGIQIANALDTLYTMGDVDADEATLGLSYDADMITSNVWAPTAQNVVLNVYGVCQAFSVFTSNDRRSDDGYLVVQRYWYGSHVLSFCCHGISSCIW